MTASQNGLQQVKDPNGYIIHNREAPNYSAFTSSIINSTLNGNPTTNYRLWRTKYKCSYPGPSASNISIPPVTQGYFKFIF